MTGSQPTAKDLLEAVRHEGETWEALAARLPISLSTVNRWKRQSPADWQHILELLRLAGWLRDEAGGAVAAAPASSVPDPESVGVALRKLTLKMDEAVRDLGRRVEELEQQRSGRAARTPARKRRAS